MCSNRCRRTKSYDAFRCAVKDEMCGSGQRTRWYTRANRGLRNDRVAAGNRAWWG